MKAGVLKEEEERLKSEIISNLELQFVDEFLRWKEKQSLFNEVVLEYNRACGKRLRVLGYDEFCRLFMKGSKSILDEHIKMDNIMPDPKELEEMRSSMENEGDANDFSRRYAALIEAKYTNVKRVMADVWDECVFRLIVLERYGMARYQDMLEAKHEVVRRML